MEVVERFWSKVDKTGACWIWMGTQNQQGYGRFAVTVSRTAPRQKLYSAHRVAWELVRGAIPDGTNVCHHCDIPSCVNPDHLFLGTDLDNARDRDRKRRRRAPIGEMNGRAKLSAEDVRQIRADFAAARYDRAELARRYGVTRTNVSAILARAIWRAA